MSHYRREHHQEIAECLACFNTQFLVKHQILFGGGTRIALELDEYRKSVDIDFLCPNKASYRAVREQVSNRSLGKLVQTELNYQREIQADRYAARTLIKGRSSIIKLEFVAFDNYQLSACHDAQFIVPYIDQTSCFMTKLLANADRYRMKPHKDIFDLIVMFKSWGMIPQPAFQEAYSHYGEKVINEALVLALEELLQDQKGYAKHALDMDIAPSFFNEQIMPAAKRLLQSLNV